MNKQLSDEYLEYINSNDWRSTVNEIANDRGNKCERCGQEGILHGHHKTYRHFGQEWLYPDDVEILCGDCHFWHHTKIKDFAHYDRLNNTYEA